MCDIRYLKRAMSTYGTALREFKVGAVDEYTMNTVAYNLQQTVELILKCHLEFVGVTVPSTHDISKLIRMCMCNGAGVVVTEWLDDNSEKLTFWEAQTRYNMDFFVETKKAEKALIEIKSFMDMNYVTKEMVLTDEQKKSVISMLPKHLQVTDGDLVLYYSLYRKRLRKMINDTLTAEDILNGIGDSK